MADMIANKEFAVRLVLPRSQEPLMRLACRNAGLQYEPGAFIYTDEPAQEETKTLWGKLSSLWGR